MAEDNHGGNDPDEKKRPEHVERQPDKPSGGVGLLAPGPQQSFAASALADPRADGATPPDVPSYPTSLLGHPVLNGRGNQSVRNAVTLQAQQTYGNRAVQRYLQRARAEHSVALIGGFKPSVEDAPVETNGSQYVTQRQSELEERQELPIQTKTVTSLVPNVQRQAAESPPVPVQRGLFSRIGSAVGGAVRAVGGAIAEGGIALFERGLRALGLPVDAIMGFLRNAGGALMNIIRNPGSFLSNLLNAVKGGFLRFKDNIGQHLQAGLVRWLTGVVSGAGLQMPTTLDFKGIFSLVLQVLGLTVENIRGRVTKMVGAQNMRRVEMAWSVVSTIVGGGVAGLWEKAQQYLGNLKDTVVEEIKSWAITQIVQQAVLKIISMFNPAGALAQIAMGIYNLVMFLREQGSQIIQVYQSVVSSLSAIAGGNIQGAITAIERTLANLLPVVMGFLARLLGLGGIGARIRAIIAKVRKPVEKAIDKTLQFVLKGVKGLVGRLRGAARADSRTAKAGAPERGGENVKNKVNRELSSRLNSPVKDHTEFASIIKEVGNRYKSQGLKSIRVTRAQNSLSEFAIFVEASPIKKAQKKALNQKIIDTIVIGLREINLRNPTTGLVAGINIGSRYHLLGRRMSSKAGHAERRLIDELLKPRWASIASRTQMNTIVIFLTRSPCPDCTNKLNSFVAARRTQGYRVGLELHVAGLYTPQGGGGAEQASEDLEKLILRSQARIKPWDILGSLQSLGVDTSQIPADARSRLLSKFDEIETEIELMDEHYRFFSR